MTNEKTRALIAEIDAVLARYDTERGAQPNITTTYRSIVYALRRAKSALSALTVPDGDDEDVLAYLITAHRFKERGLRGTIGEPDIAIARPLARFLLSEGFSRAAAAPEPEWEFGYTSKWGICRRGTNVVAAEQDANTLRRSIEEGRESGDLEHHGKLMRRARFAPGPWVPLPVGGETE